MSEKPKTKKVSEPALARKNMDMDVRKLDAARAILGARSDTEAIDRALDYVIAEHREFAALDRLHALGGLDDVYGNAPPARRRARGRKKST
jgi:hypothetical protein